MLEIVDLHVEVEGKRVLRGVNLHIEPGEVHILLGPNGSGKTTLINAIIGSPKVKVVEGKIIFKGRDITDAPMDERVKMGLGVAFQHPPKIRGVKLRDLLQKIASKFNRDVDVEKLASVVKMEEYLSRDVNVGFSGGELKRSEVLQLLVQSPDLALLDEPDSGVDVENLTVIANAINELCELNLKPSRRRKSAIMVTHLGYILNYVKADRAHVILNGRIACSGNPNEILKQIMEHGFERCVQCLQERELRR
ncbi:MAG: Fe-S cluster assembly ATPase SufC [Thermoprotei archaeon]|nr:MAG: Fe-S cluster assembly ATPase SufC [Thermoprotei archaeon]RLF19604.1 MAG: Fe-S cluster assembly ATPase SufC [Thermoprotei archaeon]